MGSTARTAGALFGTLQQLRSGEAGSIDERLSPAALQGKSPRQIAHVVADCIRPNDGTQDADASRSAISQATSDLLTQEPDADLLALTDSQVAFLMERFIGHDLAYRVQLDLGAAVISHAGDAATGMARLEEIRSYVIQKTTSVFESLLKGGRVLTKATAARVARDVIKNTLVVFESYVK